MLGLISALQAQNPWGNLSAQNVPYEALPATPLVFIAYAFVWGAVAFYVFLMWRRLQRVERELREVRDKLGTGPMR